MTPFIKLSLLSFIFASTFSCSSFDPLPAPQDLKSQSRHHRIDLTWKGQHQDRFEIQRASSPKGPFINLEHSLNQSPVFSDPLGSEKQSYYYRVRALKNDSQFWNQASEWTQPIKGMSRNSDTETFLTEIQEANFRYFWDFAHPVSGLPREGTEHPENICTSGATGMACFNIAVGIERGFITRDQGVRRSLKILDFLNSKAQRFHGAFSHWIDGTSGEAIPFGEDDDGADLVETAFLMEGLLFWREYFDGNSPEETKLRQLCDKLWREVEWDWFLRARRYSNQKTLLWHWSPHTGFKRNMGIFGFNECHMVYLLAIASPTHSVPLEYYHSSWQREKSFQNTRQVYNRELNFSRDFGPPLFFLHYSYMGLDPKQVFFAEGKSYFDEFVKLTQTQIDYAKENPKNFKGYGALWGLTASIDPERGYTARRPGKNDNGTITPTAAMASFPYTPKASLDFIKHTYKNYGKKYWGPFAFYDAFNPELDWIGKHYLAIDVGPIAPMIENHRTGLGWKYFMQAPEIKEVLQKIKE